MVEVMATVLLLFILLLLLFIYIAVILHIHAVMRILDIFTNEEWL